MIIHLARRRHTKVVCDIVRTLFEYFGLTECHSTVSTPQQSYPSYFTAAEYGLRGYCSVAELGRLESSSSYSFIYSMGCQNATYTMVQIKEEIKST